MDQVFAGWQVYENRLAIIKICFGRLWIWKRLMIL